MDYLSRHATQWKSASKSERDQSNDLSKLLYILHVIPVLDTLWISETAEYIQIDTTLTKLKDLILDSKKYISQNLPELQTFRNFLSKIIVLNNEILTILA